jgi:hypothetical protein
MQTYEHVQMYIKRVSIAYYMKSDKVIKHSVEFTYILHKKNSYTFIHSLKSHIKSFVFGICITFQIPLLLILLLFSLSILFDHSSSRPLRYEQFWAIEYYNYSNQQLLRIVGVVWSARRIPTAVISGF